MSKPRFLPPEVRSRTIDIIAESYDIMHEKLDAKYRAPFISDSMTDTKLIGHLEILGYWSEIGGVSDQFKKKIQDLKEEIADYVLLEELSGKKKNSSDR